MAPISLALAFALALALALALAAGCENTPPPPPVPDASANAVPLYVPPPPEGCVRAGALEGIENDAACIVPRADDAVMREAMKHLAFDLKADAPSVIAGGTLLLRLSIANTSANEVSLVLDEAPIGVGPRPDWTRLAGVPEPRAMPSGVPAPEGYRLSLPVRTLDTHDHSVDGLPTSSGASGSTSSGAGGATPVPRFLRVRLKPGAKLAHTFTWWALRIPAPAPITRDDAGHRFVPKTAPVPLPPAEYVVNVELPLHGISPPESIVSLRVTVDKIEKPDASAGP